MFTSRSSSSSSSSSTNTTGIELAVIQPEAKTSVMTLEQQQQGIEKSFSDENNPVTVIRAHTVSEDSLGINLFYLSTGGIVLALEGKKAFTSLPNLFSSASVSVDILCRYAENAFLFQMRRGFSCKLLVGHIRGEAIFIEPLLEEHKNYLQPLILASGEIAYTEANDTRNTMYVVDLAQPVRVPVSSEALSAEEVRKIRVEKTVEIGEFNKCFYKYQPLSPTSQLLFCNDNYYQNSHWNSVAEFMKPYVLPPVLMKIIADYEWEPRENFRYPSRSILTKERYSTSCGRPYPVVNVLAKIRDEVDKMNDGPMVAERQQALTGFIADVERNKPECTVAECAELTRSRFSFFQNHSDDNALEAAIFCDDLLDAACLAEQDGTLGAVVRVPGKK